MALSDKFEVGETVVCSITIKTTSTSALTDPTSIVIQIADSYGAVWVSTVAMTNDGTGVDHYDFQTVGVAPGKCTVRYTATDGAGLGARITIHDDYLTLV